MIVVNDVNERLRHRTEGCATRCGQLYDEALHWLIPGVRDEWHADAHLAHARAKAQRAGQSCEICSSTRLVPGCAPRCEVNLTQQAACGCAAQTIHHDYSTALALDGETSAFSHENQGLILAAGGFLDQRRVSGWCLCRRICRRICGRHFCKNRLHSYRRHICDNVGALLSLEAAVAAFGFISQRRVVTDCHICYSICHYRFTNIGACLVTCITAEAWQLSSYVVQRLALYCLPLY